MDMKGTGKKKLELWIGIVLLYGAFTIFHIGCPILFLTGIPCLGCGMTRACIALLRLDFVGAYSYHPLVFFLPPAFFLYLFKDHIRQDIVKKSVWAAVLLFLLVYIFRLLDPEDMLVKIDISNGFIYKVAYSIRKGGILGD